MRTGSEGKAAAGRAGELPGPLYLDASALAKLCLPEPGSDELDRLLVGRRDLVVSDLAVTETVSALVRRRRAEAVPGDAVGRLQQRVLQIEADGIFGRAEIVTGTHREAERLLLSLDAPLRAADALHLALAIGASAATVVTYDQHLAEAARRLGLTVFP